MTPQAFPKGPGLRCQVLPANVHSKVTSWFYTLWFFQMSWAASLLGAIMMLIGVAGTEDQGSCRFSDACHPTGDLSHSLPTPSLSSITGKHFMKSIRAVQRSNSNTEKHGNKRADIFNMSLRLWVLDILPRWNQALDLTLSLTSYQQARVGGGRVWVSGIKTFQPFQIGRCRFSSSLCSTPVCPGDTFLSCCFERPRDLGRILGLGMGVPNQRGMRVGDLGVQAQPGVPGLPPPHAQDWGLRFGDPPSAGGQQPMSESPQWHTPGGRGPHPKPLSGESRQSSAGRPPREKVNTTPSVWEQRQVVFPRCWSRAPLLKNKSYDYSFFSSFFFF